MRWVAAVMVVACAALTACGGRSEAAARACAASVDRLESALATHADAGSTQIRSAARRSFRDCGSAALWTIPATGDGLRRSIPKGQSLHSALRTLCSRYDPHFDTPVCEDRHENG